MRKLESIIVAAIAFLVSCGETNSSPWAPYSPQGDDGYYDAHYVHPSAKSGLSIDGYNVYYGILHNHTEVSDGKSSPEDAYEYARDKANLDFFGIADHDYYPDDMTDSDWSLIKDTANALNQDGTFVTFWGFEWTSDNEEDQPNGLSLGHFTVVNSDDYCISSYAPTRTLNQFVAWLSGQPDAIAFFNHPGVYYSAEFNKFEFNRTEQIVGMELWNGRDGFGVYYYNDGFHRNDGGLGYYDEAIQRGWYIGASGSDDNHGATWGTRRDYRMAVLSKEKTRAAIYDAMQARRFFSTLDKNLALSFTCNGAQMGSRIAGGALAIEIEAADGDNESFTNIRLLKNGAVVKEWTPDSTSANVTVSMTGNEADYFYTIVRQADGDEAISSPIFITSGNFPAITVGKTTYDQGEAISVEFINGPGNARDSIVLANEGSSDSSYLDWLFTDGTQTQGTAGVTSGSVTFATGLAAGSYEARLAEDGQDAVLARQSFTVREPGRIENLVLAANGGVLESFASEYSNAYSASELTDGVTDDPGWCSAKNPGQQEFIYSFRNGNRAILKQAVIHSGSAEGEYFSKDVEVWSSSDGSDYTLTGNGTLRESADSITLDLGDTVAERVKLVVASGYRNDYWELGEFVVNGVLVLPDVNTPPVTGGPTVSSGSDPGNENSTGGTSDNADPNADGALSTNASDANSTAQGSALLGCVQTSGSGNPHVLLLVGLLGLAARICDRRRVR